MEIKVLGSGCAKCKHLLQMVEYSVKELNLDAKVIYVTDMISISLSGIMNTPGLIVNGKIVSTGRVPRLEEIKELLIKAE
ncbi:MAG: TM0996/MTH895 family glutaredoxin-like protein [Firmicutes bacterium]|nr:TM0996/MTH895 family glutaredoxin-like protein [Bacillota bacterium]